MPALADQHDVIAANERLTTDLAAALKERDDLKAKLDATTKERDELAAKDSDLNRRVAAEVAKHGIRSAGLQAAAASPTPSSAAKTATERVLEAKGVQTLQELAAKAAK